MMERSFLRGREAAVPSELVSIALGIKESGEVMVDAFRNAAVKTFRAKPGLSPQE
jgi:hypothetical protein